MNKKGFTIVELMTTFVLVAIISTLLIRLVITLKEIYINGDMKTTLITKQSTMTDKIYKDLKNNGLIKIEACENTINCVNFVYTDTTKKFQLDKTKKTLTYDNYTIKLGKEGYFGDVSIDKYNSDIGYIINLNAPIYNKLVKGNYGINITYQLNNDIEFDNDIQFDIQNTGVTVTFDPAGGTVSQTTKQVTVGDTYGKLPIPEREGYEFKGWNGKNMFDISKVVQAKQKISTDKTKITFDGSELENNNMSYLVFQLYGTGGYLNRNAWYGGTVGKTAFTYTRTNDVTGIYIKANTSRRDPAFWLLDFNNLENGNSYTFSFEMLEHDTSGSKIVIDKFQIEEGETATEYEPYYIDSTTKVVQNKNHTLKAIWEKKESTFLVGRTFNGKIKQLAGDTNGAYNTENTTITNIKRYNKTPKKSVLNNAEIVSTSDSKYPIYAWFDNGTIYYYTEAKNPYLNSDSMDMFQYLTNVKSIDVNTFDTSNLVNMQGMFHLDVNLENIDVSNFNTKNVTNMYAPFKDCIKLKNLDFSSFDMSNVTNTTQIIYNTSSLTTFKTPKEYPSDSSKAITLPATFKDSSNNTYTSLNNASPKNTTLTKQS